jgi:hypothetical protein
MLIAINPTITLRISRDMRFLRTAIARLRSKKEPQRDGMLRL